MSAVPPDLWHDGFILTAEDIQAALASGGSASVLAAAKQYADQYAAATAVGASTSRSIAARLGDYVSVRDHGAVGNGSTIDTAAFQRAWLYAQVARRGLYVPAGIYVLDQALAWAVGPFSLMGDGQGLTKLVWAANAATRGLAINLDRDINPATIQGITLATLGSSGTAVSIDGRSQIVAPGQGILGGGISADRSSPRFILRDVNFRGGGSPFTTYWDKHVTTVATLIGIVEGCTVQGGYTQGGPYTYPYKPTVGFEFGDTACLGQPTQFMVRGCTIMGVQVAVSGINVQGLQIESCALVGVHYGVSFQSTFDGAQPHCTLMNSHVNSVRAGVYVNNGAEVLIQGNDLYRCSDDASGIGYGVQVEGVRSTALNIQGNNFSNSSATETFTPIFVDACQGGLIDGNTFRKYVETPMNGIYLAAGAHGMRVGSGNTFIKDPAVTADFGYRVTDLGTATVMDGAFVLLNKNASQSLAANTPAILTWDLVQDYKSNNGLYSAGSPTVVTIGVAGLYRIAANVTWNYTNGGTRALMVLIDGQPRIGAGEQLHAPATAGGFLVQNISSAPIRLAPGHTISLQVTASVDCEVLANQETWLSVERLCDG